MVEVEALTDISYAAVLVGIALVAWGVGSLLALNTLIAQYLASILVFLAAMTSVAAVVHFWRYGQHK